MHTYDDDCDFTVENLWSNVDHYFLVHLVNWFLASLVIRDAYVLHLWQVLDEWVEISAQHVMPHFRECWWDHLLMDITFTNIPAIIMGLKFVRWMGYKEYDWFGRKGKKSFSEWEIFHW
jgi:phosphatidylserine synthase 2